MHRIINVTFIKYYYYFTGDSFSSAELLKHENRKLLPEAQQLQERALKVTKATEQLVSSGCFAGAEASKQAYTVLSATSEYLSELQNRDLFLDRVISFFKLAQTVSSQYIFLNYFYFITHSILGVG